MPKTVILFLAANPDGTTRVALDEECAATERELRTTDGRDDFELCSRWAVTVDDVMRALNELKPAIIHFSGHGDATGILLHGRDGAAHPVTGAALTAMIDSTDKSARLVVLNVCFSDVHAQPLSDLVGCAVGMSGKISDDAAQVFSVAFYRALGNRHSAYVAFDQAKAALAGHSVQQQADPQCITRVDVDASALVFSGVAASASRARATQETPPTAEPYPAGIHVDIQAKGPVTNLTTGPVTGGDGAVISIGFPDPKRR